MFAIIFPIIFIVGGAAFAGLGGFRAWRSESVEESGRYLRVVAFGVGMLILGIISIFVINAFSADEPEVIKESQTQQETTNLMGSGSAVKEEGALSNTGATSFGTGKVGIDLSKNGTGATAIVSGSASFVNAAGTGRTVIADSEVSPHLIVGTPVELDANGAKTDKPKVLPHTGAIKFVGLSYSVDGQPVQDLYVNEKFQINLKVENGDYFVWDTNMAIDSDSDGVAANDYDIAGKDPILSYDAPGTYDLNLTAINSDTLANKAYKVTISEKAPEVSCEIVPDKKYPAHVYLDASKTKFYSSGEQEFAWRVDDQEITFEKKDENTSANKTFGWYTLPAIGTYNIECEARVKKDENNNSYNYYSGGDEYKYQVSQKIEYVLESLLSVEILNTDKIKIAPADFMFTAHAGDYSSTGLDETIVSNYIWDFGDGSSGQNGAGKKVVSHTFSQPGIYTVSLSAVDKNNRKASDSYRVFVSDSGAPVADFTSDPKEGYRNQVFTFDAAPSLRSDGSDRGMSFTWDFGDGSVLMRGRRITHRFAELGEYEIRLSATDESGGQYDGFYQSSLSKIHIVPVAPTADFRADEISDLEIDFDAGASSDPDNNIQKYQWDFGDGANAVTEEPHVRHVYNAAGSYEVYLMVRDLDGKTAEVTKKINIDKK
ncbi:MAG: PKD domain-containing protein [Patescibacteria group bacterium]|nr:PKD domain-containing protein [Patescibacteria group bacterium]